MKIYAYIHIISLALLVCGISSCRSNSSLSENRKETFSEQSKEQLQSAEQSNNKSTTNVDQTTLENSTSNQQTVSGSSKNSEKDEYKTEETDIVIYDKDGNVRAMITNKKQSGQKDKTTEQSGSSRSTNQSKSNYSNTKSSQELETDINKTVDSEKKSNSQRNTEGNVNKTNSTDSRLVQGIEWIYAFVGAAIGLIVIACVIIYFIRKRKKMTITVLKEPNNYCFIGNAVTFEVQADSYGAVVVEIISNGIIRKASYYPFKKGDVYHIAFDIAGYLYIPSENEKYPQDYTISILPNFSIPYQVKIGDDYIFNGIAFKGGISNQVLAVLEKEGFDIFSYRLGSHFDQFLFTTRTHSKLVKVRESELYPFVFIHPGIDISFKAESGKTITAPAQAENAICVLDIAVVRQTFHNLFGEIPNMVEVLVAGEQTFAIQITPNQKSEEKYTVRFRNSLGAFEVIELIGTAEHEPTLSEPDIFQALTDYGFYTDRRDRLSLQDVIKVETGYKTNDEILFIRDMVCSEETYFINPDGTEFRCNVSVDKMVYREKRVAPESVSLIITNENNNRYVSPNLDTTLISGAGIFDDTFDETYE